MLCFVFGTGILNAMPWVSEIQNVMVGGTKAKSLRSAVLRNATIIIKNSVFTLFTFFESYIKSKSFICLVLTWVYFVKRHVI